MQTPFRRLFAAMILAASAYGAQPPWEKPSASWSAEDIAALLSNSPWSVQTVAVMEDPRDAMDPRPAGPPDTGNNGMAGSAGKARWDGEPGHNRMGHLATVPVTVCWESALPIREARKELAATANSYVISLAGLLPAGRYRAVGSPDATSSSDGSVDARNPEEVLETFMSYSKIVVKGFADLHPQNVKLDPTSGTVRVFFTREKPIDSSQKEVLFLTHFGNLSVRAKFRLSSMKYHGNIEL